MAAQVFPKLSFSCFEGLYGTQRSPRELVKKGFSPHFFFGCYVDRDSRHILFFCFLLCMGGMGLKKAAVNIILYSQYSVFRPKFYNTFDKKPHLKHLRMCKPGKFSPYRFGEVSLQVNCSTVHLHYPTVYH